jgi:TonB-dependent SusC/RagA subfamily outer membrane receptor
MKTLGLFLLMSTSIWAQSTDAHQLLKQYFSNPNQRIEIKNDTIMVYWWEPMSETNRTEFRDTSILVRREIAQVKVVKGRNRKGERGIGLQIFPVDDSDEKRYSNQNSIGKEKLDQTNAASIQQKLQGQAAGVQIGNDNSPGGNAMVRIHGIGSINANSPLYVVDGVPLQGNMNVINPNDVESVKVLKDPAETAMYGVRGANGVILITTIQHKETNVKIPTEAVLPLTLWCWGASRKALLSSGKMKELIRYLTDKKEINK